MRKIIFGIFCCAVSIGHTMPVQENDDTIPRLTRPTVTLDELDAYFVKPVKKAPEYAQQIFDLFKENPKDLTATKQASQLLPEGHVLGVHKFQRSVTQEGQDTICTQNAQLNQHTPISYTGVIKYQTQNGESILNVMATFDLTGANDPKLSVIQTSSAVSCDQFQEELKNVGDGVTHVAIFGSKDSPISTGTKTSVIAIRRKIPLSNPQQREG